MLVADCRSDKRRIHGAIGIQTCDPRRRDAIKRLECAGDKKLAVRLECDICDKRKERGGLDRLGPLRAAARGERVIDYAIRLQAHEPPSLNATKQFELPGNHE